VVAEDAVVQSGNELQLQGGIRGEEQRAVEVKVDLSGQGGRQDPGIEVLPLQGCGEREGTAPVQMQVAAELAGEEAPVKVRKGELLPVAGQMSGEVDLAPVGAAVAQIELTGVGRWPPRKVESAGESGGGTDLRDEINGQ
jgi:hypothetical protein